MNIQDAIKAEKEIQKQVQEIKDQIAIEVCDGNYSKTAIIPFSALDRCILSASYYIQSSQAEIVEKKLNSAKTATQLNSMLREMVESGFATTNSREHSRTPLNPKTISILKTYIVSDADR